MSKRKSALCNLRTPTCLAERVPDLTHLWDAFSHRHTGRRAVLLPYSGDLLLCGMNEDGRHGSLPPERNGLAGRLSFKEEKKARALLPSPLKAGQSVLAKHQSLPSPLAMVFCKCRCWFFPAIKSQPLFSIFPFLHTKCSVV